MPRLGTARAAARRQQITDAALICFARQGFHKTTMQDVVAESGLSPGAIYCHFAGKEDIVLAVVEERHRHESTRLALAAEAPSFEAGLERIVSDFLHVLDTPQEKAWRRLTIQIWAESLHDPRLLAVAQDGVDSSQRLLSAFVRRARDQGKLPATLDADIAARLLVAFFQGLVLQTAWDATLNVSACVRTLKQMLRLDA